MRGISEFIKDHNAYLNSGSHDSRFPAFHLTQIGFLQHERFIHLIVMLFIAFSALLCLALYLYLELLLFGLAFILLLILTLFYVFHYYKLENTVIEWYFVYNKHMNQIQTKDIRRDDPRSG